MEKLCFGKANDKQCKELAVAEVVRSCGLPSTDNSTAGMFVAHQDCKNKLVIDLDGFGKMCDEINSMEENEAEQGRLTSNAQAIKVILLSLLLNSAYLVNYKTMILMNCCVVYVGERG